MKRLTEIPESSIASAQNDNLPWYALQVQAKREQIVHRALEQKGYELFFPTYVVSRRWSDRMKQIRLPLFPGYIFCRLDPNDRLPVLTTQGVVQLVGHGKRPVPVAEEEIASLKTILKSALPCMPWSSFVPGNQVVIESGPLMGVQGVLLECRNSDRLVVSVELLNRAVAVEIQATWVRHPLARESSFSTTSILTT
jgi:transcription antitermination factor NusG